MKRCIRKEKQQSTIKKFYFRPVPVSAFESEMEIVGSPSGKAKLANVYIGVYLLALACDNKRAKAAKIKILTIFICVNTYSSGDESGIYLS